MVRLHSIPNQDKPSPSVTRSASTFEHAQEEGPLCIGRRLHPGL